MLEQSHMLYSFLLHWCGKTKTGRTWSTEMANEDKLSSQQFSQRWETTFTCHCASSEGCSNADGFLAPDSRFRTFSLLVFTMLPVVMLQDSAVHTLNWSPLRLISNQNFSARVAPCPLTGQIHWRQLSTARTLLDYTSALMKGSFSSRLLWSFCPEVSQTIGWRIPGRRLVVRM